MTDQAALQPVNSNVPIPEGDEPEQPYSLTATAHSVYDTLAGMNRQQVIDMGRQMASLTIPSVMPPLNYRVGDDLPGTNQSTGALYVNNLASKLMFMAFPPGQPMMRMVPNEQKLQKDIDADPDLYARIELALSRVEYAHRLAAAGINLATVYCEHMKLLLVAGNSLWKHVKLSDPTFHKLDSWVCSRDTSGHPLLTIHEETVRVIELDPDVREMVYAENPEMKKQQEWSRETTLYSVCKFIKSGDKKEDGSWEYWQETEKGQLIPGTSVECDFDDPPMWPCWLIPVYGQNYGRSYCEEYRGDLYIVESNSSALNDGAAQASLALTFVKPGGRTSLRQVQKAPNLSFLSGSAEDMTTFRAEKSADFNFVTAHLERAEQRLAQAFLKTSSVMRNAERVTAEEVQRVGQDLDQAMGGVYTQIAQGNQKHVITRLVKLNSESDNAIPQLPPGLIRIEVITGVDAMGRSLDAQNLVEFGAAINQTFPPNSKTSEILDANDFGTRLASYKGIKPDGLVKSAAQVQQENQAKQQQASQADLMSKAVGGASGPATKAMMDRLPPSPAQSASQQPPQAGAQ